MKIGYPKLSGKLKVYITGPSKRGTMANSYD